MCCGHPEQMCSMPLGSSGGHMCLSGLTSPLDISVFYQQRSGQPLAPCLGPSSQGRTARHAADLQGEGSVPWDKGFPGEDQTCAGANSLSCALCLCGKEIQGVLCSFHLWEYLSAVPISVWWDLALSHLVHKGQPDVDLHAGDVAPMRRDGHTPVLANLHGSIWMPQEVC